MAGSSTYPKTSSTPTADWEGRSASSEQREFQIDGRTVLSIQMTLGAAEAGLLGNILSDVANVGSNSAYADSEIRFAREYLMVLNSLR